MSFASCSTRFESSPARTSDVGLHVDSARTMTSSPEFDAKHGLAGGVVAAPRDGLRRRHERVRTTRRRRGPVGTRTAPLCVTVGLLASKQKTGCGTRVPAPRRRPSSRLAVVVFIRRPLRAGSLFEPFSLLRSVLTLMPSRSDALRAIALRHLERAFDQLRFRFVHVQRREHHRAFWNRDRRCPTVAVPVRRRREFASDDSRRRRSAPRAAQAETLAVERVQRNRPDSLVRITARSTACCNSRTLPGQSYPCNRSIASGEIPVISLPISCA